MSKYFGTKFIYAEDEIETESDADFLRDRDKIALNPQKDENFLSGELNE